MKDVIRGISVFLIVCFVSSICPLPAFSADVQSIMQQLTPQQKQQLKSMSPQERAQLRDTMSKGDSQPNPSVKQQEPQVENKDKAIEPENAQTEEKTQPQNGNQPAEELTEIEKGFLDKNKESTQEALRQFGYDMFSKAVGTKYATTSTLPIGPNYRINPGDKLLITIWGNVNDTFAVDVDDRGAVTIPKVGVVPIAGYKLSEAKDMLYQRLSTVFVVDFNIDVTVKEIGSIKVYLLGDFNKPGAYTILANSTLYDAIFLGGGPNKMGSLRNIQLVRNGYTLKTVDLYNFILKGKKNGDILLESGDVVKVPTIQNVAAVSGNVKKPAIYELVSDKTELSDFINLSGGITPTTYLQRIQIQRKKDNKYETAIDVKYSDYLKIKNTRPIYISNLDFISVFSIEETIRNVVYLSGSVIRPGMYELDQDMTLFDLLKKAEGLAPDTYMQRAQIIRLAPPDMNPKIITVDLNKLKAGDPNDNPILQEFDKVRIFSRAELEGKPKVFISGEINDGDSTFPLTENMKISDLIFQAGGIKESTYLDRAMLYRTINNQLYTYTVDLNRILLEKDQGQDMRLIKNDYLLVMRIPDYQVNATVLISGEVIFPGKYVLYRGMRLSDLIKQAGGYTSSAFVDGGVFIRQRIKDKQSEEQQRVRAQLDERKFRELSQIPFGLTSDEAQFRAKQINNAFDYLYQGLNMQTPGRLIIDFAKASPGNNNDVMLVDKDMIDIPSVRIGVTLIGAVYSPGTIVYQNGKSADDYISMSGGYSDYADSGNVRVIHASGKTEKKGWGVRVGPGDTVFVPEKIDSIIQVEKPFDWNSFWDITFKATTTFAQVATSLVTLYLLYKTANK